MHIKRLLEKRIFLHRLLRANTTTRKTTAKSILETRPLNNMASPEAPTATPTAATPPGNCLFCKIARGEDSKTTLLYQDEEYAAFKDIHPCTTHHYLIVPKQHIKDAKTLTLEHIPMVKRLIEIGKQVLQEQNGSNESLMMGFHWPPFNSVAHLHLHIISPLDRMSFISRLIFRPGSLWFITTDDLFKYIEDNKKS